MPGTPGAEGLAGTPDLAVPDLVGRAAEVAAVRRTLGGGRLVTVTGLPGVGKTAVGLAAAGEVASGFAGGSLLLPLEALRDEALLPHTIAAALQLPDDFARGRLPVLAEQLRDRHLLVILDTCEHLLGACASLIAALLPACPKLHVLATSREPLRVPGEAVVAVRPLRLADAVELFGRHAARAGVVLGPEHRAAVASVCVQLDKLPLAIELAAAQLADRQRDGAQHDQARRDGAQHDQARRDGAQHDQARREGASQPLTQQLAWLLAQLEAGHDVPRGDGEPGRHRTLRAAIGWSHELCTPSERLLWARLSVFTGLFRRQDAQDVCVSDQLPAETVAAGLSLLAERSVLLTSQRPDGSRCYLLPATLRGYGRRMLCRIGQEEEFTARHQRWQDGCRPQHDAPAGK
jgi:predicted ATPase